MVLYHYGPDGDMLLSYDCYYHITVNDIVIADQARIWYSARERALNLLLVKRTP